MSDTTGSPPVDEDSAAPSTVEDQLAAMLDRATAAVTAIEQHAREASAESTSIGSSNAQAIAAAAEAQSKVKEILALGAQATAATTAITDAQTVIATKSDHIEGAQKHADLVRGNLDRALTAAQAQATDIDALKTRVTTISDSVEAIKATVTQSKTDADAATAAARQSMADAQKAAASAQALADKADEVDERIQAYEARLADLEQQSQDQLATIIGLLPGATSAGLASAFDKRRETFLKPSTMWQVWFVASVLALVLLAITGLFQLNLGNSFDYTSLLRVWLSRLPVALALIWLAIYSSRESALAKRLEEDYGYKSAIAASFQGFQKQMQEIQSTVGADSPLGKLCHNTLTEIANPPGRIYEKHELTVTPSTEIKEVVSGVTDALAKILPEALSKVGGGKTV